MTRLAVSGLAKRFAGLLAVDDVTFAVMPGTVHGLIGPNGAGKTTLFNLISGVLPADHGQVVLDGHELSALPVHRRTAAGLARTFQNIRLFDEMTALENVLTGMHLPLGRSSKGFLRGTAEMRAAAEAEALLGTVGLGNRLGHRAGDLAYGDQRRLEIARALASRPRLLMLDEPAAGMNPAETADLARLLRDLRQGGLTILLVEHDMHFVMGLCDRLTVLNFGRVIAEGPPAAIHRDPVVIEAYLGPRVAERLAHAAPAP